MSVAELRSRFSTHQSANFGANSSRVGFAHPSHLLGAALRASFAPSGRHRGHVLTDDTP